MILSFSGPPSSGKTKTLELVRQRLGWPALHRGSGSAWVEYYLTHSIDEKIQWWTLPNTDQENYQLAAMAQACADVYRVGKADWLFDRSPIDYLIFTKIKATQGKIDPAAIAAVHIMYRTMKSLVKDRLQIMLFSPDQDYPFEERSQRTLEAQSEITAAFLSEGRSTENVFLVPKGSLEKKADAIVAYVERMQNDKKC